MRSGHKKLILSPWGGGPQAKNHQLDRTGGRFMNAGQSPRLLGVDRSCRIWRWFSLWLWGRLELFITTLGQGRRGVCWLLRSVFLRSSASGVLTNSVSPFWRCYSTQRRFFLDLFPIPPPLEQLPRMIPSVQEMVELSLPNPLTMEEHWNSLIHLGKPDFVATKIATQGL